MLHSRSYRFTAALVILLLAALPAYAGGGGWLIKPLGLMLGGAMLITIILTMLNQTSTISFIVMGFVMGSVAGGMASTPEELEAMFPGIESILTGFQQIGVILIFFMAGLQFDISDITKRGRLITVNGVGYLLLGLLFFYIVGSRIAGTDGFSDAIYLALCLTVPSAALVGLSLENNDSEGDLYGQIAKGVMVICSLVAVILLAKMDATKSVEEATGGAAMFNLWMTEGVILLVVVLMVLSKIILEPVLRFLLRSAEMLFISALGYCMGIASICGYLGISPEAGAFFAGVSIGILPYRIDVEDKVGPLKSFGQILFFITLGVMMARVSGEVYASNLGSIVLLTILVLVVKPIISIIMGYFSGLKARPTFKIGLTLNQGSEITIILALLAWMDGLFSDKIFAIAVSVTILSFILSAFGNHALDRLYDSFKGSVAFLERNIAPRELSEEHDFELKDHVVLLTFNELSQEIADFYEERGERVLLVDIDPEIYEYFREKLDGNIVPLYADGTDHEVWSTYQFDKAKLVVSCDSGIQDANVDLARYLKNSEVPFLCASESNENSLELYDSGARFVINPEQSASKSFRQVFEEEIDKPAAESFTVRGESHWKDTREIRDGLGEIFKLV